MPTKSIRKPRPIFCRTTSPRREDLFRRAIGRSYLSAPDGIDGVVYVKEEDLPVGEFINVMITAQKDYDLTGVVSHKEETL